MDRKIVVDVNGSYLRKDNKIAGVQGEGNSTYLNLIFDEGWSSLAKKITFWNSNGMNPVEITLTTDHLTNMSTSLFDYTVPIPPEPLEFDGEMEYVIDGYKDGIRVRSLADKMVVKYAPTANNAGSPADPTPTQAEQLQKQIDTMLGDMQAERIKAETAASTSQQAAETSVLAKGSAESAAQTATTKAGEASDSASAANTSEENAKQSETNAKASEESAANYAQTATNKALEAEQALENAIVARNSAETAKSDAETARNETLTAKNESIAAKTSAETAKDDAISAKTAAETAQSSAEQAKSEAAAARDAALTAKNDAESAKESAETAKTAAETAQSAAETARDEAVTARDEALTAKNAAETAQSTAETARDESVSAKEYSVAAKEAAETAKNESISAKEDAIAAKTAAETARDQAQEIAGGDFATKTELNEHVANADIHVTVDEKTAWNEKDVFIATYGTTTSAEIEEAYQSGKTIVLNLRGSIIIPFLFSRSNATRHIFAFMFGAEKDFGITISIVENDVWNEPELYLLAYAEDVNNSLNTKANKSTISTSTMSASVWSDGVYSFESTYPVATYDIEVEIDGDSCTAEQLKAWNSAQIVGSSTTNSCKALGDVPTIDIPIIIKAVVK